MSQSDSELAPPEGLEELQKRYQASFYSEHDITSACHSIRNELNQKLAPEIVKSYSEHKNTSACHSVRNEHNQKRSPEIVTYYFKPIHCCAPFEKIHVSNGRTKSPVEDGYLYTVLHEAWMPIWHNENNTQRIFYFVQYTHGRIIHGLAWIDYHAIGGGKVERPPIFEKLWEATARELSIPLHDSDLPKQSYGIYGKVGSGKLVGRMLFGKYEHYDESLPQSLLDSIQAIVTLMTDACKRLPKVMKSIKININQPIH